MPSLDFETQKIVFREYYNDNSQLLEQAKESLLTLLRSLLARSGNSVASATGRIKDREESIKKFTRKYQSALEESATPYVIASYVTDLIGLRLVCLYEDEIEPIRELVSEHFEVIDVTDKTAEIEGTDNAFGYKGLHLDLRLKGARAGMPEYELFAGFRFELQIRTIIQDSWSTLDHKIKYKKSIPASLKRRINTLAALFELADREFRQVRQETAVEIEKAEAEVDPVAEQAEGSQEDLSTAGLVPGDDVERGKYAPLDAFRLQRIARHFFTGEEFEPRKIDGFTAEVVKREPTISRGKFHRYLHGTIGTVRNYRTHFIETGRGDTFNAFTGMRHALYAANPAIYAGMLTNVARENFDAWLEKEGRRQGPEAA